ncbi:UDP-N-acetylglucosamine--peptide N-acetylglucosaminyltransferase [Porphyridium purpureum]|uniref:UDP-N-acetylglucosamine--peptide N-acetylglucosaminyltransferase n=1 Tax=Porphyridium purpureum TaxID=35688 RepID=A0A5J4Z8P3_PORPP|nr:UDP-N-acetylglucosamine--peptide N-acetylglucosaminyltransferase [Porphyridium purpureum]|eukprot:POR5901..scf295_1
MLVLDSTMAPKSALATEPQPLVMIDQMQPQQRDNAKAGLSDTERKELLRVSKENSRVTGAAGSLFNAAKRDAEQGKLDEALSKYSELAQSSPNFAGAYSNRGNVYVALKKYEEAVADYTRALELAPLASDSYVVLVNRGSVYAELNDFKRASADFSAALELRPDESLVYVNRATLLARQQKWTSALNDYQRAVEKKPNDVEPFWLDYAMVLYQINKPGEALGVVKRVAAKYGTVDDVNAALSVMYYDKNDLPDAEGAWGAVARPRLFTSKAFLEGRHWTPRMLETLARFQKLTP